ncbi:SAM-dependent methyltransferase [Streptomyces gilvosporeus]|uniref:SAM-dependent methyltransferase n=1 Tax=Streptomyces gilvosporeus TaxID=553510 RepID=A0A1V0TJ24_9ACTN|nr:methyltransferase domain-containing protein [Streptomyces gilvosporeus]ARF52936.1 SAM-dependent methyltransferase [Streptomyces gilvosporeus]
MTDQRTETTESRPRAAATGTGGTGAAAAARAYYDSSDVDAFYDSIWGGEDIHIGIYAHEREQVRAASRRTIEHVVAKVAHLLGPGRRVLDLGSGYGGAARYLAEHFGCRVTALNISEQQNRRHRTTNAERGLDGLIEVVTGSFDDIPFPAEHFDVVWSQDALCHSGDPGRTLGEVARVLGPEGEFVFTDIMAADDTPAEAIRPLLTRLAAPSLTTPGHYQKLLPQVGLAKVEFEELSQQLRNHYTRLTEEARRYHAEPDGAISPSYLARVRENLPLWQRACRDGLLVWGIYHCRR